MDQQPLPLIARLGFSLWMLVWVPIILASQGPQNFWWLCNMAQFILLYAVWRPNRLLVSSQAGTVVLVGIVWTADLALGLAAGGEVALLTGYMFNPELPLSLRLSSLYHLWLPFFVVWLCWYGGYDGRGVWLQCAIGTAGIIGGRLWSDPARNVNFAFAPFNIEQVWLPDGVYLVVLAVGSALLVYVPGHFLVRFCLRRLPARAGRSGHHEEESPCE